MLAAARNDRSSILKNSASSPPGAANRRVLDVFAVTTHQNEHVGVAVPGVHPGLGAGNVNGELWDGDQIDAIDTERLHGSCARCPNSLHFGNGDDHCWPQNSTRDPRHKYLQLTIVDPYRKYS